MFNVFGPGFRIESTLVSLGWSKIEDKMDKSFKLKWVECKSQINYSTFRDGKYAAYYICHLDLASICFVHGCLDQG